MPILSKIKRVLLSLLLAVVISGAFALPIATEGHVAEAGSDFGNFVNDLFETGEQGASFTEYSGQLATLDEDGLDESLTSAGGDLREFIIRIVNFALSFLGLLAVVMIIYAGVMYVGAAGNDEAVGKAKKVIMYSVIGLLIVLGSFAFVNTIISGAKGESDGNFGGLNAEGRIVAGGFNAAAEQIRGYAVEIVNGFDFLTESTEALKNIQNDTLKATIIPEEAPSKANIIAFLNNLKAQLINLKSKVQPYSITETKINELNRQIELDISEISRLGETMYFKGDLANGAEPNICDADDQEDFIADIGDSEKEICREDEFDTTYIVGLYETWYSMYNGSANDGYVSASTYNAVLGPIADDYATDLRRIFTNMDEVLLTFANLDLVRNGEVGNIYQTMAGEMKYGYKTFAPAVAGVEGVLKFDNSIDGFYKSITGWGELTPDPGQQDPQQVDPDINIAGQHLTRALEKHSELYEAIKGIQSVNARLSADVIEGSSPLTVLFDTVGTIDPAGGSLQADKVDIDDPDSGTIKADRILWDLGGILTFDELYLGQKCDENGDNCQYTDTGKLMTAAEDFMDCTTFNAATNSDEQVDRIGKTAQRCTFTKPGTYKAAIRIKSNSPTQFADGISYLTVKVRPPTNRIHLDVTRDGGEEAADRTETIMSYDGDVLLTDRNQMTVTLSEAKRKLEFDATNTKATQYKWDFGDGEIEEFSSDATTDHAYKEPGRYKVVLEVVNELGVKDKKIFTILVQSIAARISASPAKESFINKAVIFNSTGSKSDLGNISTYRWEIRNKATDAIVAEAEGSSFTTFSHEFEETGSFKITLTVSDSIGETAEAKIDNFEVISRPPVALFDSQIRETTQPGTVHLNAARSYDPDGDDNFSFEWILEPEARYTLPDEAEHGLNSETPIIKFEERGTFQITLKVIDNNRGEELDEITSEVTVDSVLDIAWAPGTVAEGGQPVAAQLDENGEAPFDFRFRSDHARAYEIDFGDGETEGGDFTNPQTSISHTYEESGRYMVRVTVYDEEDNDNYIKRRIFIGDSTSPIAIIKLSVDNAEVLDLTEPVKVNRKDLIDFTAEESQNIDGSGRDLRYSWSFGDTERSSNKKTKHTYDELTPPLEDAYVVTLTVTDKDDPTLTDTDEVYIDVVPESPSYSWLQPVLANPSDGDLTTPVAFNMEVYNVEDDDGEIVRFKWWYFDVDDPEEELGVQVTTDPRAQITIGTIGQEGQELTYGFGLEITDNDSLTFDNREMIDDGNFPTVTVFNGQNEQPTAKFNVDTTSVFVGNEVSFNSSSTDPDGEISEYIWDLEGDGFYNNEPTDESSITHEYSLKNLEGVDVKLKVIDDKGGESVSEPIKIYVDSLAKPPKAAFKYEVVPGSAGMKVRFKNNSQADEDAGSEIISYKWDFDTNSTLESADSDGDGLKDNDVDSQAKNPQRLYSEKGIYQVTLTITDNQGNTDSVSNAVTLPLANPPTAAFTYEVKDDEVHFRNNSSSDRQNAARLREFIWDFDTASVLLNVDSDGDGSKDNDRDASDENPVHQYEDSGKYFVKLTVIDDQGNEDFVVNEVVFTKIVPEPEVPETPEESPSDDTPDGNTESLGADVVKEGNFLTTPTNDPTVGPEVELIATPNDPVPPETPANPLDAKLVTEPGPDFNHVIWLDGDSGNVKFNFSKSTGAISHYIIDKNIHFDTGGDGEPNNDEDFKTSLPGSWRTNFEKSWGKTVVKLTVSDIYGNEDTASFEIKFR
jgi:PKD repeat protein